LHELLDTPNEQGIDHNRDKNGFQKLQEDTPTPQISHLLAGLDGRPSALGHPVRVEHVLRDCETQVGMQVKIAERGCPGIVAARVRSSVAQQQGWPTAAAHTASGRSSCWTMAKNRAV
jgi:hypothetical protein